jgi:5'-nucleotidase
MKRIAIDMDEVIADANHRFFEWYKRDFNLMLSEKQMRGRHFKEIVPEAHREKVMQYPHTEGFFKNLPVMADSQQVISDLSMKYEIFITSAAMEFKNSLVHKYEWLHEHFPFITWKNIVFCGDKSIINADFLIDDHVHHFKHFRGQGILFSSPHNLNEEWNPRVDNWKQVAALLL